MPVAYSDERTMESYYMDWLAPVTAKMFANTENTDLSRFRFNIKTIPSAL